MELSSRHSSPSKGNYIDLERWKKNTSRSPTEEMSTTIAVAILREKEQRGILVPLTKPEAPVRTKKRRKTNGIHFGLVRWQIKLKGEINPQGKNEAYKSLLRSSLTARENHNQ